MTIEQNVRLCAAGHELVQFWCIRCPVCAVIERLDRELLAADARIAQLEQDAAVSEARWMAYYTGGPA